MSRMMKVFSRRVRPGVRLTLARPVRPEKALSRLDFPTLERPATAISGRSSRGTADTSGALISNCASTTRQRFCSSAPMCGRRIPQRVVHATEIGYDPPA